MFNLAAITILLAIALKKGNTDLKKQIDKVLSALKQNGFYDTIFNRWFYETEL